MTQGASFNDIFAVMGGKESVKIEVDVPPITIALLTIGLFIAIFGASVLAAVVAKKVKA